MAGIIKVNQYQDFNGNTLFTSDGSGNLTTQKLNYPAFHAKSGGQSISNATITKVIFETEVLDTDNCYDTSTGRFTPNVAGKYLVYVICGISTGTDFDAFNMRIYKNGSEIHLSFGRSEYYESSSLSMIVDMNGSTDYLEAYVYHQQGGTTNLNGDPCNQFYAYRIGS